MVRSQIMPVIRLTLLASCLLFSSNQNVEARGCGGGGGHGGGGHGGGHGGSCHGGGHSSGYASRRMGHSGYWDNWDDLDNPLLWGNNTWGSGINNWGNSYVGFQNAYLSPSTVPPMQIANQLDRYNREHSERLSKLPRSAFVQEYHWPSSSTAVARSPVDNNAKNVQLSVSAVLHKQTRPLD